MLAVLAEFKSHYGRCMDENREAKEAEVRKKKREADETKRERAKAAFVAEKRAQAKTRALGTALPPPNHLPASDWSVMRIYALASRPCINTVTLKRRT